MKESNRNTSNVENTNSNASSRRIFMKKSLVGGTAVGGTAFLGSIVNTSANPYYAGSPEGAVRWR